MSRVKVNLKNLEACIGRVSADINGYSNVKQQLIQQIELSDGWLGEDADAYRLEAQGLKSKLDAMESGLGAYRNYLKFSLDSYAEMQDYLYNMGQRL